MDKIAYLTHFAHIPSYNADSVCVMNTCHALAKQGVEVELIIPKSMGDDNYDLSLNSGFIWSYYGLEENFKITRLESRKYYRFGFLGRWTYKIKSVYYASKNHDILYVRHVETALISTLLGKPTLFVHHDTSFLENNKFAKFLIWLYKIFKLQIRFAAVTQAGKDLFIHWGIDPNHTTTFPNGADIDRFNKSAINDNLNHGLPKNKVLIGFSGSLYPGRGIEYIIDTAKKFQDVIFFVVGGSPQDLIRCKQYSESLNLNNIHFIGSVLPKEVPGYLMSADMLIMPYTTNTPTHKDMSPMKMFEYMASGKPIISSDFPVIREILKDKVNAVLVEPDSAEAISRGIQWILDNPEQAKAMAIQARKDAENYTWDKRAKNIVQWLDNHLID